jgi:streptogramin lyase
VGITAGPDGNVWFAERNNNAIGFLGPPQPAAQLSVLDATVQEPASGQGSVTITVTLNRPAVNVSVSASTAPGTATSPEDYDNIAWALRFSGNGTTATFRVPINADGGHARENFYANLASPTNAMIARGQAVVTITQ